MAISDTLFEAIEELKGDLSSNPAMYRDVRPQIEALLTEMDRVRVLLDTPPFGDPDGSASADAGRSASSPHPHRSPRPGRVRPKRGL